GHALFDESAAQITVMQALFDFVHGLSQLFVVEAFLTGKAPEPFCLKDPHRTPATPFYTIAPRAIVQENSLRWVLFVVAMSWQGRRAAPASRAGTAAFSRHCQVGKGCGKLNLCEHPPFPISWLLLSA